MLPALFTTFLWSYCVIATRRSVHQLGENLANVSRILLAVISLGLIAHFLGAGLGGGGFYYFFLSGVVGFGLGDIGVFYALPRIGSRFTLLLSQCLAAPIAGFSEWIWMGTTISPLQILAIITILLGITIALAPKNIPTGDMPTFVAGIGFGVLAAVGQGIGAVLSRKAYAEANAMGNWIEVDGLLENIWMGATSGYQRLIGGAIVLVVFYLVSFFIRSWYTHPRAPFDKDSKLNKAKYVALTAASGPILGIICFQWALASTPSAIVQPIVAMTPLVVMPLAWIFEGDRPNLRSLLGSLISVGGVLLMAFSGQIANWVAQFA